MISVQIGAGVVKDLVALVGEERRRRSQKTPISFGGGIINISNGGRGATKGHHT
jgi:hypothetical protein